MSLLSYIISKLLEAYSTQAQALALTQAGRQVIQKLAMTYWRLMCGYSGVLEGSSWLTEACWIPYVIGAGL